MTEQLVARQAEARLVNLAVQMQLVSKGDEQPALEIVLRTQTRAQDESLERLQAGLGWVLY
jgi:hypothetical protein